MDLDILQKCLDEVKKSDAQIATVSVSLSALKADEGLCPEYITLIGELVRELLNKYAQCRGNSTAEYLDWLLSNCEDGRCKLESLVSSNTSDRNGMKSFEILSSLLPLWSTALHPKPKFPTEQYASLLRAVITSEESIEKVIPSFKELIRHEDMNQHLWEALDGATKLDRPLTVDELVKILSLLHIVEKPKENRKDGISFTGVKFGVQNTKLIHKSIVGLWERLVRVNVTDKTRQNLILVLIEKLMPRMIKPIFLTDYFMSTLEHGGAISLLALQGIFVLIHKHNMNYPNVYDKLYSMFNPELFGTTFKPRFYYLANTFLMSTHLPEALVAGFAKRFARLCLVAPPPDAIILLTMIHNLIVRHQGLKRLVSSEDPSETPGSDPYLDGELDPSRSKAIESSLWEVRLMQQHVLPNVASAALFVDLPLSSVEKDIGDLLEMNMHQLFEYECNIKTKEVALTFEKPTMAFITKQCNSQGFAVWDLYK